MSPLCPGGSDSVQPARQAVYFSQEKLSISCKSDMRNWFMA